MQRKRRSARKKKEKSLKSKNPYQWRNHNASPTAL